MSEIIKCGNTECRNYKPYTNNCEIIGTANTDRCPAYKPTKKQTRILTGRELWEQGAESYRIEHNGFCYLFRYDDFFNYWDCQMAWDDIEKDRITHWTADRGPNAEWKPFKVEV